MEWVLFLGLLGLLALLTRRPDMRLATPQPLLSTAGHSQSLLSLCNPRPLCLRGHWESRKKVNSHCWQCSPVTLRESLHRAHRYCSLSSQTVAPSSLAGASLGSWPVLPCLCVAGPLTVKEVEGCCGVNVTAGDGLHLSACMTCSVTA